MARCKNQECRESRTPGVIVVPKPKPQVGQTMRWGWVPCPICHPDPKIKFTPVKRSEDQIEARADLADRRVPYVKDKPEDRLSRIRAANPEQEEDDRPINGHDHQKAPGPAPVPAAPSEISGLIEALNKALVQQSILQGENMELRRQLAEATAPLSFGSQSGLSKPT